MVCCLRFSLKQATVGYLHETSGSLHVPGERVRALSQLSPAAVTRTTASTRRPTSQEGTPHDLARCRKGRGIYRGSSTKPACHQHSWLHVFSVWTYLLLCPALQETGKSANRKVEEKVTSEHRGMFRTLVNNRPHLKVCSSRQNSYQRTMYYRNII